MFKPHKIANYLLWCILIFLAPLTIYLIYCNGVVLLEWNLLNIYATPVILSVILDPCGMFFSCVVVMISANVLQFSKTYMKDDKFIDRFTILVLLFVLSMNLLIYLPHLIMLLLGWDGLGVVSFVLVIYYQNSKSLAAGMITALTNRVGDVMLLLSIAWTFNQGHWNIMHMWANNDSFFTLQVVCILTAAMTKSAQMPFSSWLPAAMAAPTPVSALVHSSTLVTAGVFLLIRFYSFLSLHSLFCPILLVISVCTVVMAGLSASTECDMKKIIALSTLSQLGFMMAALGLGMVHLAFFHMVTHAMFKALLFICAGAMINSFSHSQDLRWMGNSFIQLPVTSTCMLMANTALCGFPFMSGFYSKDLIIESSMFAPHNQIMFLMIMFAVGMTSLYSVRFTLSVLWSPMNTSPFTNLVENRSFTQPMVVLSIMSVVSGSVIMWCFPMSQSFMLLSGLEKAISIIMVGAGAFLAWMVSLSAANMQSLLIKHSMLHYASCLMWFLVPLSSQYLMKYPINVSLKFLNLLDQSWLELFGAQGINKVVNNFSNLTMGCLVFNPINFLTLSLNLFLLVLLFVHM